MERSLEACERCLPNAVKTFCVYDWKLIMLIWDILLNLFYQHFHLNYLILWTISMMLSILNCYLYLCCISTCISMVLWPIQGLRYESYDLRVLVLWSPDQRPSFSLRASLRCSDWSNRRQDTRVCSAVDGTPSESSPPHPPSTLAASWTSLLPCG